MPRGGCSISAPSGSERPVAGLPGADGADRLLETEPRLQAGSRVRVQRRRVGLPEKVAQTAVRGRSSRLPVRRERHWPGTDRRHRRPRSPGHQRCRFGHALRPRRRPARIRTAASPAAEKRLHPSPRRVLRSARHEGSVVWKRATVVGAEVSANTDRCRPFSETPVARCSWAALVRAGISMALGAASHRRLANIARSVGLAISRRRGFVRRAQAPPTRGAKSEIARGRAAARTYPLNLLGHATRLLFRVPCRPYRTYRAGP